ncbi:MAG: DUF255 domain-containing protein [Chloroflexota bacterium]
MDIELPLDFKEFLKLLNGNGARYLLIGGYAGTYFPPVRRYNMPAFKDVLASLTKAWSEDKQEVDRVGNQIFEYLQPQAQRNEPANSFTQQTLETTTNALLESYDWNHGGWGSAPKFPQPMAVEYLLRRASTDSPQHDPILKTCRHVLNAMSRGGMYDVVGVGFARYSVDNFWLVPHFDK